VNTTSASPVEASTAQAAPSASSGKILVWDAPVRVFHALMLFSFAGAFLTAESERWRLAHVTLGYTLAGLVVFRLVWGLVGTRHARFASFVRSPVAVLNYFKALLKGKPEHHVGHNPAGAWAIVALLGLSAVVAVTGWAVYNAQGGDWLEGLHEGAANAMLGLVIIHVIGVLLSSFMHRENLIGAMVTGRKHGSAGSGVRSAWTSVAVLMLVAALGYWALQWQSAPPTGTPAAGQISSGQRERDDD
jgi:cytochrome b